MLAGKELADTPPKEEELEEQGPAEQTVGEVHCMTISQQAIQVDNVNTMSILVHVGENKQFPYLTLEATLPS